MEKIILKCAPFATKLAQEFIRANVPWWPF